MFQLERIDSILEYIKENKYAKIADLSDRYGVSKVTIRRDINELEAQGKIIVAHGGVSAIEERYSYEIPYVHKSEINKEAKERIGKCAAKLINDNDIVILDSGSTTLEIAKRISSKNVTIITNDIKISMEIALKSNINTIVTGGKIEKDVYTLTGCDTIEYFRKLRVNKVFLGGDALDFEFGLSNRSLQEGKVKNAMIESSKEVILVIDHSKLNKEVFYSVCPISKLDKIIIDSMTNIEKEKFASLDIEVIIAE